jgi:hypothetical protein
LKGMVEYASKGGGNISLKIRGLSKRVHTNKSKRSINIAEFEVEGVEPVEVATILKGLLL